MSVEGWTPSREDWEAWKENPVSQFLFLALRKAAARQQAEWLSQSWQAGKADPLALCELRTRADAYLALEETDHERWIEINAEHP